MLSFHTLAPVSTGSLAIDASLGSGGLLRRGVIELNIPDHSVEILCTLVLASNRNQNQQTIYLEVSEHLSHRISARDMNLLLPCPNGSGITRIKPSNIESQIETLKALLIFKSFSLVFVLFDEESRPSDESINQICEISTKADATCVLATRTNSPINPLNSIGLIQVSSSEPLKDSNGDLFGWRVNGKTTNSLPDQKQQSRIFSTVITPNNAVYKAFDLVAAGIVSGVLENTENGEIHANGRKFTSSFDEAIARLERMDVQARLHSAIITSQPYIRL